jgi:hypothetical protein
MPKESADLVRRLGGKNVLEFTSLLLNFRFTVHRQAVGKQALRQTMAPDDVAGSLPSARREFHDHGAIPNRGGHRL